MPPWAAPTTMAAAPTRSRGAGRLAAPFTSARLMVGREARPRSPVVPLATTRRGAAAGNCVAVVSPAGVGGSLHNDSSSQTTIQGSLIVDNQATGGSAGPGGNDDEGLGGGVYNAPFGTVSADAYTVIAGNSASTDGDDVYGDLSGPAPHRGRRWDLAVAQVVGAGDACSAAR